MPFLDQTKRIFYPVPINRASNNCLSQAFILPLFAAFFSIIVLFAQFLFDRCWVSHRRQQDGSSSRKPENAKALGTSTVLRFMVGRLIGCVALFLLDIIAVRDRQGGREWCSVFDSCQGVALTATYAYVSLLAAASIISKAWRTSLVRHNVLVLLGILAAYIYRDVWPLATYDKTPIDVEEGRLLWAKIAILTITVVLIPLFIPREYIPVDPNDPMGEPNPEQTCCWMSMIFYSFLDPIIVMAAKVPHLSYDKLPPQPDYDRSKNLIKHAFRHVDYYSGAKRCHLALGLVRVFLVDYLLAGFALTIESLASFLSPLAINRTLRYIETGGEGATIRPWFWIICLFAGPMLVSLAFQYYQYLTSRIIVHAEALITQLVLEHSLRIRLRAETSDDVSENTPDIVSVPPMESCEMSQSSSDRESSEGTAVPCSEATSKASSTKTAPPVAIKKDQNLIGKINNFVTTDAVTITDARDFLQVVYMVPLQLTLCMIFLHGVLGWSAFVGLASVVLLIPVPGYVASLMQGIQVKKMEMTDARVQTVAEAVNVIRMVKLFGWGAKMRERVVEKREKELNYIWKGKALLAIESTVNFLIPVVTMLVTFTTYTLVMKQNLSASKVFSSMAVFDMLRTQLRRTAFEIGASVKAKVSLDRLTKFLRETELLDEFSETSKSASPDNEQERRDVIGFKDAHFTWSSEPEDGTHTPSARSFKLRIEGDLYFKRGKINLIIGPTGSGKTSILMALLGEMHFIPTTPDSWFSLPRQGGIAYAAQESWVQNETIRNNILFGAPFDRLRYNKVIEQCALERDLELFEAGDETEVGERGLTLSGGQKARVTLARAIYSNAEIILLDDVLAALDVHTSKWIVNKCLKGDLICGRTVLLVTHDVSLATSVAGFLVTVGLNGQVCSGEDAISTTFEYDPASALKLEHGAGQVISETHLEHFHPPKGDTTGKLVFAEEVAHGHVSWKAIKLFLGALGGKRVILFFSVWIGGTLAVQCMNIFSTWFLGYWGSQYETHHGGEVRVSFYLSVYSMILVAQVAINLFSLIVYVLGTVRASRTINLRLFDAILASTLRWLDETPTSRIITRCTQDITTIDSLLPWRFIALVDTYTNLLTNLGGIIFFSPIFIFPGLSIGIIGISIGHIYIKAQMSVKREISNAKAPVLGHFGAAIAGLTSIRAYGAQQTFKLESQKRIDHLIRLSMVSFHVNRWVSVRIDALGAIFTSSLAIYLVYYGPINAANTGFSLTMAVGFCSLILWSVRIYNMVEVEANSLERTLAYIEIEQEPKPTEGGKPPAAWPTSGELDVRNLSARYSKTGPTVLHGLSFHVKSGERVGIVGRTGSGKSSLALSLLRCIVTEGDVQYDNISTATVNLDALRSNITIIPQMPELLTGTLRRNIDPFEQHNDATLNDALRSAGLFSLQESTDDARLTLDSKIATGGGNISVGQRQIIALARAMLRGSKLLILDEATSSIDHKTDTVIQATLRNELASDVTVLTIAHRLQTIMDSDKIMVLDNGRIAEFDAPNELLKKEGSLFRSLVDESGDKAALYTMAESKATSSQVSPVPCSLLV